jgi:MFS transporter
MAFFRNNAVNLFNFHYAIHSIALSGGGAFFGVYLLKAGVSVPAVLVAIGLIQAIRFVMRPIVIWFAARSGLRQTVIAGALLSVLQYPLLAEVDGVGAVLYAFVVVSAIGDTFYWSSHHAYFAKLGDDEHRGAQVGVRMAAQTLVGIFSPFVTGWLLVTWGPRVAFDASAVIVMVGALPLLWTPNVPVARHVAGGFRAALQGTALFIADGWVDAGVNFVWQIALFQSLGENLLNYGGALAIAAIVGSGSGMILGRFIDAGHGVRMVWIAVGMFSTMIVLRAIACGHPVLAVGANALGPLGACLYAPALMTSVYTQAKRSPCVLRFHIATEGGWDIGNVAGCFVSAGLIASGVPLPSAILLSLIGTAVTFVMLRCYYTNHSGVPLSASA